MAVFKSFYVDCAVAITCACVSREYVCGVALCNSQWLWSCRDPVSLCCAVVVLWALRVRADALRCRRGSLTHCYCVTIVTLSAERQQQLRRRCCAAVVCGNLGHFSLCDRCGGVLQVSPLLSRLQLHMAVCNLSMHLEWQRWTRSRCDGMGFARGYVVWCWSVWNLLCRRRCPDCIVCEKCHTLTRNKRCLCFVVSLGWCSASMIVATSMLTRW